MQEALLDMAVALPQYAIRHTVLAEARQVDPEKYRLGLGCEAMACCGPGEDVVTLAADAGAQVLARHPLHKERIGLCIVGTESGVDGSKSVASFVHGLLALPSRCTVFDIQHACYGGTAALQMARGWLHRNPGQLALVLMSDIARYELGSAGEPTQGAGAVALLVGMASPTEACLTFERESGTYSRDVHDFWRPTYQKTAEVRGKYSISCYLEGLVGAYEDYMTRDVPAPEFGYHLYHAPFPNMARKAHDRLWEHRGASPSEQRESFDHQVAPALWGNRQVGNVYTGSLYLSLASLFESEGTLLARQRVAFFSYGSGSCSEFFAGQFGGITATPGLRQALERRRWLDIDEYELLREQTDALEENQSAPSTRAKAEDLPATEAGPRFRFVGISDHERLYQSTQRAFTDTTGADSRRLVRPRDPTQSTRPTTDRGSLFDGAR